MRTATGLVLIAFGAILAFAVRSSPSFLNLQIAGWVIMLTGIAGLLVPRRGYGWLRRRVVVRRPRDPDLNGEKGLRSIVSGRVLRRNPGLPDEEPPLHGRLEQIVPGSGEPAEETVEEFREE